MSDKRNIDELFKNGVEKQYPVDENLWAQASTQLDAAYPLRKSKKGWIYISLAVLFSLGALYGASTFLKEKNGQTADIAQPKAQESNNVNSLQESATQSSEAINNELINQTNSISSDKGHLNQTDLENTAETGSTNVNDIKHAHSTVLNNKVANAGFKTRETGQPITTQFEVKNHKATSEPNQRENDATASTNPKYSPITGLSVAKKSIDWGFEQGTSPQKAAPENANPKLPNWFVIAEGEYFGVQHNKPVNVVENGLWTRFTAGYSYNMQAGYRYRNFSLSTGIGQTKFRSSYDATKSPEPYVDTLSSYYALVTNEYQHYEKVVSLIERRYETQLVFDSTAKKESFAGHSTITYLSIPVTLGYTIPLDRFEISGKLSATVLFNPNFKHKAPNNFASLLNQNNQAIRSSIIRPALQIDAGYRLNSNLSVHGALNMATTNQSVLTVDPNKLNTFGFKLGVMTRF